MLTSVSETDRHSDLHTHGRDCILTDLNGYKQQTANHFLIKYIQQKENMKDSRKERSVKTLEMPVHIELGKQSFLLLNEIM